MGAKASAGILLYRRREGRLEVLLVHPGGPLWQSRDERAWSLPKGELDDGEEPLAAARRELTEEIGLVATGPFVALGSVRQKGGKVVCAWACAGDCEPNAIVSNTFELEWPPRSGVRKRFPEVDRAAFFDLPTARRKLNPAQVPLLDALEAALEAASRQ